MKVTLHADGIEVTGYDNISDIEEVCSLVDMLQLELEVFPQPETNLWLAIDKYTLDCKVHYSYINYVQPGNLNYKEKAWGVHYDVYLDSIDITGTFDL